MERLTKTIELSKGYLVDGQFVTKVAEGYSGEAIDRLAKFEDLFEHLQASQIEVTLEMEKLRAQGKTKSVKFRELLVQKLTNTNFLILLKYHGLE